MPVRHLASLSLMFLQILAVMLKLGRAFRAIVSTCTGLSSTLMPSFADQ